MWWPPRMFSKEMKTLGYGTELNRRPVYAFQATTWQARGFSEPVHPLYSRD